MGRTGDRRGQAVPAFASSHSTYGGSVCEIFYGGGSQNYQNTQVILAIPSDDDTIPAGTVVKWTVTLDGSTSYVQPPALSVPNLTYAGNASWTMEASPAPKTALPSGGSFTLTWTARTDLPAASLTCRSGNENGSVPRFQWPNDGGLAPGVTVTVASETSVPSGQGQGVSGSLRWKVPRRFSNSRMEPKATVYLSKSGSQTCFPETKFVYMAGAVSNYNTNASICGDGGNNSSTIYPDGTCALVRIPGGQAAVPPKC